MDSSYLYGIFGIDLDGNSYITLGYRIETDTVQENMTTGSCPAFTPTSEEAFSLIIKPVRLDVELYYNNITAFYEWMTVQNTTSNNTIPSAPWRIFVMIKYRDTVICSLNCTPSVQASDMMS